MAAKTAKISTEKDVKAQIVDAAFALAGEEGWEYVTLRAVAQRAGLSMAALFAAVEDKTDILAAFGRMIDRAVLENASGFDAEESPRERLFDLLMDRYEALNEYRAGLRSVLDSFLCDPKQALISLPHLCRSMTWILETAGIETGGIKGAVKVAGLTGLYLKVLRVWKDDETADLSKTMAALDKALGRAERAAEGFGF